MPLSKTNRGDIARFLEPNTVLAEGEIRFEEDRGRFKVGDGIRMWSDLNYIETVGSISRPPPGCFKITNIYADANGKLVVDYSDIPAE